MGGAAPPACPDAELQPHPGIRNSGDGQGRSLVPGDGSPPHPLAPSRAWQCEPLRACKSQSCRETPHLGPQTGPGAAGRGPCNLPGSGVWPEQDARPGCLSLLRSSSPADNKHAVTAGEATGEPGSSGRALCSTVVPGGWGRPRPGLHQVSSWGRAHVKECPAHSPTAHHSFIHSFARSASRQRTPAGRLGTNVPRATAGHRGRSTSRHRGFQDKHIHTLQTLQRAKPPVSPQERPFGRPCFCDANLEEVPGLGQPPAPRV